MRLWGAQPAKGIIAMVLELPGRTSALSPQSWAVMEVVK